MNILYGFLILLIGGYIAGEIAGKLQLPKLIGMIIWGCIANVYLGIIDLKVIEIGRYLKSIALVIVLLIGGFGIKTAQIKKVGRPALLLSIVPATIEGFTVAFLAVKILGFTFIQGGILGFIIAAVSPAVLVPSMVDLIQRRLGEKKAIPQMLLTGASADDSIAIALFTTFIGLYFGSSSITRNLLNVPLSIVIGLLVGITFAIISGKISRLVNNSTFSALLISTLAIGMRIVEEHYHLSSFNSLIGVMAMGYVLTNYFEDIARDIISKLKKAWIIGAIFLFTLVGTAINPRLAEDLFMTGLIIVGISLFMRSLGVLISLIGTNLNAKERLFCVIAYLPKATVQSAKAGIPLQLGVAGGEIIQALSIIAVLITAPIGAIGIKLSAHRFLEEYQEGVNKKLELVKEID